MSIDFDEYQTLKKLSAEAKTSYDRAQWTLSSLMETLEMDFGCTPVEAAEEKLKELDESLDKDTAAYNKQMAAFKKLYGDLLDV